MKNESMQMQQMNLSILQMIQLRSENWIILRIIPNLIWREKDANKDQSLIESPEL